MRLQLLFSLFHSCIKGNINLKKNLRRSFQTFKISIVKNDALHMLDDDERKLIATCHSCEIGNKQKCQFSQYARNFVQVQY